MRDVSSELDLRGGDPSKRVPRSTVGLLWSLVPSLIGLALPIAAVVALLMWFAGQDLARLEALRRDGVLTEARLVGAEAFEKQVARGMSTKGARLRFEYRAAGVPYSAEKEYLAGETFAAEVEVLYSAAWPEVHLVRSHPITDEELARSHAWYWGGLKAGGAIYAALLVLVVVPVRVIPEILAMRRQRDSSGCGES